MNQSESQKICRTRLACTDLFQIQKKEMVKISLNGAFYLFSFYENVGTGNSFRLLRDQDGKFPGPGGATTAPANGAQGH